MNDPGLFSGLVLFILFSLLGSIALSADQNHRQSAQFQVKLFLCAIALRFAVSIIIYQFGLVEVLKDEDASGWFIGVAFQRAWAQQGVGLFDLPIVMAKAFDYSLVGRNKGYYYLLGGFFHLTGASTRLSAAALNCFFGALTVILAYRVARTLFSDWVAVRVGWWSCLFPSLIIWSAQTLKEPVVIFLETLALYSCVRLKHLRFSPQHIVLAVFAVLLLVPFRFYAAYVAAAAVTISLLAPQLRKGRSSVGAGVGVAALLLAISAPSGILAQQEAHIERYNLEYVQKFRTSVAWGTGSGVKSNHDLNTVQGFGLATVVGGAHLLLAPFPWQLGGGSVRMLMTGPELIVWWWLFFIGVLPGLWYLIRNRLGDTMPLLVFILGMGLLYSLMFGNIGLVYRQRAQLLPWLLIFAIVGLEQRVVRRVAAWRAQLHSRPIPRTQH